MEAPGAGPDGAGQCGAGGRVARPGDRVPSCLVVGSRVVGGAGRACCGARTRRALSRASRPGARNARECEAGGAAVSHGGLDIDGCNSWPPGWWWPVVCVDVARFRHRSRAGLPSDVHDDGRGSRLCRYGESAWCCRRSSLSVLLCTRRALGRRASKARALMGESRSACAVDQSRWQAEPCALGDDLCCVHLPVDSMCSQTLNCVCLECVVLQVHGHSVCKDRRWMPPCNCPGARCGVLA